MPTDAERPPSLQEIDSRLAAIRERRRPKRGPGAAKWRGAELAWRMVVDLTAGIAVGLGIGWGLDVLLGTKPLFMVIFVLLGFAAGVRVMLRSAEDEQRKALKRAEADAAARAERDAAEADRRRKAAAARGKVAPGDGRNTVAGGDDGTTGAAAPKNEGR